MENDEFEEDYKPSPELLRLVEHEEKMIKPHEEEIEKINLGDEGEEKIVKIGGDLSCEMRHELCTFFRDFRDIFAWSYKDIPTLDPKIVQHRLPLKPETQPIKQRLRRMKPEVSLKIKEVEKQFNAGFLAVTQYP